MKKFTFAYWVPYMGSTVHPTSLEGVATTMFSEQSRLGHRAHGVHLPEPRPLSQRTCCGQWSVGTEAGGDPLPFQRSPGRIADLFGKDLFFASTECFRLWTCVSVCAASGAVQLSLSSAPPWRLQWPPASMTRPAALCTGSCGAA